MDVRKFQIAIPKWVFKRKTEVMYLVLGPDGLQKFKDVIEIGITDLLIDTVNEHVKAHINEGVMPPDEIAPVILNISDDVLAGRTPTLRAGDYISLQNYIRHGT